MPPKHPLAKLLGRTNTTLVEVKNFLETTPTDLNIPHSPTTGATFLMTAAENVDDVNIVKYLIEKGADITLKNKVGMNALHYAVMLNSLEMVRFLVEQGLDVNSETNDKRTVFFVAVTEPYIDNGIIDYLLEKGADINRKDIRGVTPLMSTLFVKNNTLGKFLIEKGADVTLQSNSGKTALHFAVDSSNFAKLGFVRDIDIVKLLVEKGANVNAQTITGESVLMEAVINHVQDFLPRNRLEIIQFLLQKGADKTLRTKTEKTAMDFAKTDVIRRLVAIPIEESKELFKGFTKSDIDILNRIFEAPSDISVCPICLEFAERTDGCMYMTHSCRNPHKELFAKYSVNGLVEWCTLCGRVSYQHKHYVYAPPDANKPGFAPVQPTAIGDLRFFDKDCKASGGGGHEEKVRRFNRMLHYACELQSEVGKISEKEGRKELIEETWKGADIRMRNVPKILEQKKFDFPCEFPADTMTVADEKVYPDIPKPAGLQPNPVKHESPDNECIVELGEHADRRPVYQFIHKQPDGTTWEHKDEYICAEDLESAIRSKPMDGTCPINPEKCKGKIYPEELKGVVSDEFYEVYRKNFNKANAAKTGGAGSNMFNHVVDETCAMPPKKAGRRKTYRKKKNQTKKRRTIKRKDKY